MPNEMGSVLQLNHITLISVTCIASVCLSNSVVSNVLYCYCINFLDFIILST